MKKRNHAGRRSAKKLTRDVTKRDILMAVVLLVSLVGVLWLWSHQKKPNVIFIMVDTLRSDYLGTYGFDGPVSPSIDSFAKESIVFTNAYSQAPWIRTYDGFSQGFDVFSETEEPIFNGDDINDEENKAENDSNCKHK